jgi:allophanate hydrolase subunit 2
MEPLAGATEEPSTWDSLVLRVRWGPRQDWFSVPARDALLGTAYRLSVKSNRVGARLQGESLTRANAGELPSEGLTLGAVQVPADGQPLVFLADHPTTGGYPVIAVVDEADLPLLAQARPGATVSFSLLARETRENSRPWT